MTREVLSPDQTRFKSMMLKEEGLGRAYVDQPVEGWQTVIRCPIGTAFRVLIPRRSVWKSAGTVGKNAGRYILPAYLSYEPTQFRGQHVTSDASS